jgi:hypothetical protein
MLMIVVRYILLQGLSGVGGGFLQIVPLIVYYVKLYLLGSTPRSVWGIKYGKTSVAWGTLFPGITLLVVIGTSIYIFFQLNKRINSLCYYSPWLLYHCACHQRTCLCRFLPVLSTLQISFLICIPTTHYNGYGRIVLPQGIPTCPCGIICTTDLFVCFILFGDGQQWSS